MTYVRCGWYFCPNHLGGYEHGTPAARWWRKDAHGNVYCPEHSHLLDTPKPRKAATR